MAPHERRAKRYDLPLNSSNSSFGFLKFCLVHNYGECRLTLPQEMGLMGVQENMVTEAFVTMQRERFKKNLHPLYLPLYEKMIFEMERHAEGTWWAPYSGYRTFEEQLKLYQKGRLPESVAAKEPIVTYSQPGDSAHNWGCATDWAEFNPEYKGSEAWSKANWRFFQAMCRKSNMDWGGDWDRDGLTEPRENDFPHCQLALRCAWKKVGDVYRLDGEIKALEFILDQSLTDEEGDRV